MSAPTRALPNEKDLLLATMDLPTELRADYLNKACGSDINLKARVKELLKNAETGDSFMAQPAVDLNRTTAMSSIEVGGQIGRYRLMEQLGEGGMGVVYVAEQVEPVRRKVALKVIKPGMDSKQVIARFEAERQALALMDHPNIASVLDAGTTEQGLPYFVMELVRGLPITEHCDRADLSIRQRLELFRQVCRAVGHAHQKGVIHRDLKPSNVLVAMHDTVPVVMVIDFGVAKAIGRQLTDGTLYTGFSQLVGTPLYMSPEQAGLSGLDIDTRSDIYSLGVLLYELLIGTTPFDGGTLRHAGIDEMRRIIRDVEPQRPSARASTLDAARLSTISQRRQIPPQQLSRQLRGELDWIAMRALEKDRTRRYETVAAFAADVEGYLNDTVVQAGPPTWRYRYSKLLKRNKSLVVTGLLVLSLIFIGTTLSIMQAVRATQAERVAQAGQESERKARLSELAARKEAERAKHLAQQNAADTYRQQYRAEMQLGQLDLATGNLSRLYQTLAVHLPAPLREDQRGWEWYYLLTRCLEARTLGSHNGLVSSIDWSPNGQFLATTSYDGTAIVWDAKSGRCIRRFSDGETMKRGVAWSPDSQRLAWGSTADDNTVRIWNRGTDEIRVLRGHTFSIYSCNWSPDGKQLVTTAMDNTARIWDAETWECLHVLGGHAHHVSAACWTADRKSLVTAGHKGIKVWDAQTGEQLRDLFTTKDFTSASISPALQQQLVLSETTGDCHLVDVQTWQIIHSISAHAGNVTQVSFHPDGSSFASAGGDGTVKIWDARDGRLQQVLRGPQFEAQSLSWSPDGTQIVAACSDGTTRLWALPPPVQPVTFSVSDAPVVQLHWDKDDPFLKSVSAFGAQSVWDRSGTRVEEKGITSPETPGALSPNGRLIASPETDINDDEFTILVRDVASHKIAGEFEFTTAGLADFTASKIVWSPDSKRIAEIGYRHFVVWSIPSGQKIFTWSGPAIKAAAWAPDSNRLAIAGGGDSMDNGNQAFMSHVHIFDVEQKLRVLKKLTSSQRVVATSVAWDSTGERIAAGNEIGQLGVWDARTGLKLASARPHVARVNALDWAPDGRRIASVSTDGTLKVLDSQTADELLSLLDGKQPLTTVKWSLDGARLASADESGRVHVWDAASDRIANDTENRHREIAQMYFTRGSQSLDNAELTQATSDFAQAIKLAPSRADYRKSRAIAYARQGLTEDALVDLTAALDLDPDDESILSTRVALYAHLGRWREALADVSKRADLNKDFYPRYERAVIQAMLGDTNAYREICQRELLDESADLESLTEDQLWTCALLPQPIAEIQPLQTLLQELSASAIDGEQDSEDTRFPSGEILFRAGQLEVAVRLMTNESRRWEQTGSIEPPTNAHDFLPGYTWYFLAMACHDLGHYSESRAWYDKAEHYSQTALSQPVVFQQPGSINWHQRAVLELLQRETRSHIGAGSSNNPK